eukprot:gene17719-23311_t
MKLLKCLSFLYIIALGLTFKVSDNVSLNVFKGSKLFKSIATIVCTTCISFNGFDLSDSNALVASPINYGIKNDRLLPCKALSNCISTSSVESVEKYGRPWTFTGEAKDIYEKLIVSIRSDQFLDLVESIPSKLYVHATAKSAVPPTGIDDIEFLINPIDKIITYRSGSRELVMFGFQPLGDGGSNKNRLESIRGKLGVNEMKLSNEAESYIKEVENMGFIQMMNELSQPNDVNFLDNSVPAPRDNSYIKSKETESSDSTSSTGESTSKENVLPNSKEIYQNDPVATNF